MKFFLVKVEVRDDATADDVERVIRAMRLAAMHDNEAVLEVVETPSVARFREPPVKP